MRRRIISRLTPLQLLGAVPRHDEALLERPAQGGRARVDVGLEGARLLGLVHEDELELRRSREEWHTHTSNIQKGICTVSNTHQMK